MKLPFSDPARPTGTILGPALEGVLDELCDRRQPVLVATPYIHYESRFLERQGSQLLLRATMSRDAVRHALGPHPLRLRFAWALAFFGGPTRILAYEQGEQHRVLRLQVPDHLAPDEQRRVFRIDRTGRSTGAVGSEDGTILRVNLEDLSSQGAGIFCLEAVPTERFQAGRAVDLSLTLDQGPSITLPTRICHGQNQNLGLVFHPPLAGGALQRIQAWLAPREAEARQRWENRAELRARAERLARPKVPPSGILLVSGDPALPPQIAAVLAGSHGLRTVPPGMAPFKEALEDPPLLLLVDTGGLDLEGRHRLRGLLEAVPGNVPVMVLGRGEELQAARRLAAELRAAAYLEWNPQQALFFRRLTEGLIRHRRREEGGGA